MSTTTRDLAEQRHTPDDRVALGRSLRASVPRTSHRLWEAQGGRVDPVRLLEEQNAERVEWLVPLRHGRMGVSPFTFYRGTARIMAADLATTPSSGLTVQLGGDAHLSNFGAYGSPERQLVFDANDFDETLPGPWEWDLKRLATSFTIGGQQLGFDEPARRRIAGRVVRSYRTAMHRYARLGYLDIWYDHLTITDTRVTKKVGAAELETRLSRFERKARAKTSLQALEKLAVEENGHYRIRSDAPVLFPLRELPAEYDASSLESEVYAGLEAYKATLSDDRRWMLDRFEPVDVGVKVVGVGSVGTRCLIILLQGRDRQDPLFLQIKEAGASVLEDHLAPSVYANHGRRVVEGQRLAQAESDIFLGWVEGGPESRHFYLRQLRDWKGSVEFDSGTLQQAEFYARLCGMTLARGHARSGDPIAIAAYMGKGDTLDLAVADFGEAYAVQNRQDYDAFMTAIDDGRIPAVDPVTFTPVSHR
jgi:uncharacterized protein (DUF2252 family)